MSLPVGMLRSCNMTAAAADDDDDDAGSINE